MRHLVACVQQCGTFSLKLRTPPPPPAAGVQLWTGGAGFLSGLTALQDLSLATTELTSPGHAASLRHMTGLTRLQLHNNALAEPKEVADMVASMPHLQLLSVSFTTLDSRAVVHIARSLRHLSALLFDGCPVSTLGVVQCLRVSHCKLRCWSKGEAELQVSACCGDVCSLCEVLHPGRVSRSDSAALGLRSKPSSGRQSLWKELPPLSPWFFFSGPLALPAVLLLNALPCCLSSSSFQRLHVPAALSTWYLNCLCAAALAERRDLPRWMNLMDLILVATPFPHCRKLRMLHQPEQTMTLTAATALGVTLFFLLYLGLLMAFFTAGMLCWLPQVCTQICQPCATSTLSSVNPHARQPCTPAKSEDVLQASLPFLVSCAA